MTETLTLKDIAQAKKKLEQNSKGQNVVLKCSHLWRNGGKFFSSSYGVEVCEKCASEISKELSEKLR